MNPISASQQQQGSLSNHFTLADMKRAISNNLPCFYLQFEEDLSIDQLPSTTKVAHLLNHFFRNKWEPSFKGFTLCSLVGKNRLKIGTNDKNDYFNLINSNWPEEIENKIVKINKPNFIPDCFAFVVRQVPNSLPKEQVVQYICQTIKSAVNISEIKYLNNNNRPIKDYRFAVTDINEYYATLCLGRMAIGNQLFLLTPFRSSYKMTYCTKCWKLGHMRETCNKQTSCRICLSQFEKGVQHQCQGPPKCAQCGEEHWSLDNRCLVVQRYRIDLKHAIADAITRGKLSKNTSREINKISVNNADDFPMLHHPPQGYETKKWNQEKNQEKKENMEILNELQKLNRSMNDLRADIVYLRKKLIEENKERIGQKKIIQLQQQNLVSISNQVQIVIKTIIDGLPELDNKIKKKIDKQMKVLVDMGNSKSTNDIILNCNDITSPQSITTDATATNDPGGGNCNKSLDMGTETIIHA
ncbi:unnamed protein product [Rotaria sp. Silwood2]|nr:unnamed protein product [Rotaria sp. Silwood2]